jgi:tetratricopeptide (TPR) repeat protein
MMNKATAIVFFLLVGCTSNNNGPPPQAPGSMENQGSMTPAEPTPGARLGNIGRVDFPTSCTSEAQGYLSRGVMLLHHMTYAFAKEEFAAARKADPTCVIAIWGTAMSRIHPLWPDVPSASELNGGWQMITAAKARTIQDPREAAYLATVEAYYRDGTSRDERSRLATFRNAWQSLAKKFPDDQEAAAFFALAHLATADPNDKTYRIQKEAGVMAEAVLAKAPNHPGAHHYIIHAYDLPELAPRALSVARSYGNVAPNVPHALHMASHIFTRLGLWQESIAWNLRSAKAAEDMKVEGALSLHYLHALDYLTYAYLQIADDDKVVQLMRDMKELKGPVQEHAASAYTLAAVPARYALERHAWKQAASLEPRTPRSYNWDSAPEFEAISHFARALGAAHTKDFNTAQESINEIQSLQKQVTPRSAYWGKQLEIQKTAAQAWLAFRRGNSARGLSLMQRSATMEASTEKNAVTPGEVLPANELLGDMLVEMGRYQEAASAYQVSLKRSPSRFNSLFGAGMAAEKSGDKEQARTYYTMLAKMCQDSAGMRNELMHARSFLSGGV